MQNSRLFIVAVLFPWLILSCSAAEPPSMPAAGEVRAMLERGDHRFLDTLHPSAGIVERLRDEDASLPYVLARAMEVRGLDDAARRVYQMEIDAGHDMWAGLSAVRLARRNLRLGAVVSAEGHARRATELLPQFRDGWFLLGSALYEQEAYRPLLDLVDRLPQPDAVGAGEAIGTEELYAEAALWRAVARWELQDEPIAAFGDAFLAFPAQAIHERLYLYLYYRGDALQAFPPDLRLLMESVYRGQQGQAEEALRLLRMVEPHAVLEAVLTPADEGRRGARAGLWATIDAAAARRPDNATRAWLARLREAAELRGGGDLVATVDLLRATAAGDAASAGSRSEIILIEAATTAESSSIRDRAIQRWLDQAITGEAPLHRVVQQLSALDASADAYAHAVDRLLPAEVRRRAFDRLPEIMTLVPDGAPQARAHVQMVMLVASDAGYSLDLAESTAEEVGQTVGSWPVNDYFGLMIKHRADEPVGLHAAESEAPPEDRAKDRAEWSLDLRHADALVSAGRVRSALAVAMDAARRPDQAVPALRVAEHMSRLGYVSAALDLARRAVARGDLSIDGRTASILFPLPFRAELIDAAERYDVPPAILTGLVREESHFRPSAESVVGAQGLSQLMPSTAEDIRRRMDWYDADVGRPSDNLRMGAYYLNYLGEHIESPILRLAAYNAGLGRGRRWEAEFGDLPRALQIEALPFAETRWYLRRITVSHAMYYGRFHADGVGSGIADGMSRFLEGDIW